MPRPELDLVAYKALRNELLAIECKSFLDSLGVTYSSFVDPSFAGFKRYKIFNDRHYWRVIKASLVRQLVQQEAIHPKPDVVLCLSAGRIRNEKDRQALARLFAKRRWRLYDDSWIAQRVSELATQGYTNNEGVIALKIAKRFS